MRNYASNSGVEFLDLAEIEIEDEEAKKRRSFNLFYQIHDRVFNVHIPPSFLENNADIAKSKLKDKHKHKLTSLEMVASHVSLAQEVAKDKANRESKGDKNLEGFEKNYSPKSEALEDYTNDQKIKILKRYDLNVVAVEFRKYLEKIFILEQEQSRVDEKHHIIKEKITHAAFFHNSSSIPYEDGYDINDSDNLDSYDEGDEELDDENDDDLLKEIDDRGYKKPVFSSEQMFENLIEGYQVATAILEREADANGINKANITFIVPKYVEPPEDFNNILFIQINGTGDEGKRRLVIKVKYDLDSGKIIIDEKPYVKEVGAAVEDAGEISDQEKELIRKMKINAVVKKVAITRNKEMEIEEKDERSDDEEEEFEISDDELEESINPAQTGRPKRNIAIDDLEPNKKKAPVKREVFPNQRPKKQFPTEPDDRAGNSSPLQNSPQSGPEVKPVTVQAIDTSPQVWSIRTPPSSAGVAPEFGHSPTVAGILNPSSDAMGSLVLPPPAQVAQVEQENKGKPKNKVNQSTFDLILKLSRLRALEKATTQGDSPKSDSKVKKMAKARDAANTPLKTLELNITGKDVKGFAAMTENELRAAIQKSETNVEANLGKLVAGLKTDGLSKTAITDMVTNFATGMQSKATDVVSQNLESVGGTQKSEPNQEEEYKWASRRAGEMFDKPHIPSPDPEDPEGFSLKKDSIFREDDDNEPESGRGH